MSDFAKQNRVPKRNSLFQLVYPIDFSEGGNDSSIGVHELTQLLPANHDILQVDYRVKEACVGTNGTISFGVDDDSEPDDLLDDTNVSALTLDAKVAGIPRIGTAATQLSVGATDKPANYKIKTTAFTAGKIDMIVTLLPTA